MFHLGDTEFVCVVKSDVVETDDVGGCVLFRVEMNADFGRPEERVAGRVEEIPASVAHDGHDNGFIRRSSDSIKRMYFPASNLMADV